MNNFFELNYSKINSYNFCPFLYKFIYIEGKYTPFNAYSSFGLSIHKTLDKYAKNKGDFNDLLIYYEECWRHEGYNSPSEMMEFYLKGKKILENFWLREQSKNSEIIFSEKDFEFDLDEFKIKGTIDRVDRLKNGKIELIEYKTGNEERDIERLKNDKQLAIYAVGLKRCYNLVPDYISFYLLSLDSVVTVDYDVINENKILEYLKDIGKKIINGDFSRKGNCNICIIKNLCKERV